MLQGLGINTVAQITRMDYPIGQYVGNLEELEVFCITRQGLETLDIVVLQCAELIVRAGIANCDQAEDLVAEVIANGRPLKNSGKCVNRVNETTAKVD